MKNAFSIKIVGLAQMIRAFQRMPGELVNTINAGMKEAAFEVERSSKIRITSGPERAIKTGYLRSSIGVTSLLPFKATIQAQARYGIYVHEGTSRMRARPFLYKGLQDAVPTIERIFGKRVKTVIQNI